LAPDFLRAWGWISRGRSGCTLAQIRRLIVLLLPGIGDLRTATVLLRKMLSHGDRVLDLSRVVARISARLGMRWNVAHLYYDIKYMPTRRLEVVRDHSGNLFLHGKAVPHFLLANTPSNAAWTFR
jgi:hypothetical protein